MRPGHRSPKPMNRSRDLPGLISDPDIVASYSEDALGLRGEFDAVCRPETEQDVAEIIRYCAATATPATVQGLRSSLTGASMAQGGIAISMERMNSLKDLGADDRTAVAEAGLVVAEFKERIREAGLFYPPDPTSEGECTLGGNVATNASGAAGLKYGSTRKWVRRIRGIDGQGRVLELVNRDNEKNCCGFGSFYDPATILVGSEGTLAVVTEVELRLASPPQAAFLGMAFFPEMRCALDFVVEARNNSRLRPTSIEFLDEGALGIIRTKAEGLSIPRSARVMVYFDQEYGGEKDRERFLGQWFRLIERHTTLSADTQVALTEGQKRHLRDLRHHVPESMNEQSARAVKNGGCKISTDWAVPYSRLHELFAYYDSIRHLLGEIPIVQYGHIGQGHPHFNFIAGNAKERDIAEQVDVLMARKAVELGGTIAAEHGIGKLKAGHLSIQYPEPVIEAMKAVKRTFDPKGILAPGNIFPSRISSRTGVLWPWTK